LILYAIISRMTLVKGVAAATVIIRLVIMFAAVRPLPSTSRPAGR
jgi:hypothetical protein